MTADNTPRADDLYVSTGKLPPSKRVQALLEEAHQRFGSITDGNVSGIYPALARVPAGLFGLAIVGIDGTRHLIGDAQVKFPIMSVVKPFTFALLCAEVGAAQARSRIGSNATGLPFNSLAAVEQSPDGRTNPMVNAGAIATVAALAGRWGCEAWPRLIARLSLFADRELQLDEEVYASAAAMNHRNRALAALLYSVGALDVPAEGAVELYTRACCVSVSAEDLSVMGAVLADAGVHPVTRKRIIGLSTCRAVLSVMTTAGLYESSGDWLYDIGLPGKSGISGGIITIAPGKGALATYAPPLDLAGNSLRGQRAAAFLSRELGLDLFAYEPG